MRVVEHRHCYAALKIVLSVMVFLFLSAAARSQDDVPLAEASAGLRATIEEAEAQSDFRAMILAAVELRDTAEVVEDRIYAQRSLGRGYALLGDFERAVDELSSAVADADPSLSPTLLAEIYRDAAGMLGEVGRPEQALALIDRGLATLVLPQDVELETELLLMRSSVLGLLGRLDESLSTIKDAMDRPLSIPRQQIKRRNNLGMIHKLRGELNSALSEFRVVYERAQAVGSEQLIVYALLELGDVERQLGDLRAARSHLDNALTRAESAGEARWALFAHMYLAELATDEGNEDAAAGHYETVQSIRSDLQDASMANRARVLEISLEVLEREKEVKRLQIEGELQEMQLQRSRNMLLLGALAAFFLLVALVLAIQKSKMRATANRELDRLANTDVLTGLHNRRYFLDQLRRCVRDGTAEGALIMNDIDHFKKVNDRYGHDHGDAVLHAGAERIQSMMRTGDVLARWGGEEFLAFLPGCSDAAARQVADRILATIQSPAIVHEGVEHHITATLGVSRLDGAQDLDTAVRNADEALRQGKQDGRNQVRYSTQSATGAV